MAELQAPPASPVVGVGAVLVHDRRLLVVQRGREPAKGLWTLPGGRLEPGELICEAVVRELAEETGIVGVAGALVGVAERIGDGYHFVIHDHWVHIDAPQTPIAADDAADARWVTESELRALPTVPGTIEFLAEHGVVSALRPT